MKFILYAFRVTIGTYMVLNRSNWMGISTRFNMQLVVTSTKACKNVSMANYSLVISDLFRSILNLHTHFKYIKKLSNEKFLDIRELDENFLTYRIPRYIEW